MGSSSKPTTQTTTSVQEPPEYVKGPAKNFLARAETLSNVPYSTYTGERIAPLTPVHHFALDQARNAMGNQLPQASNVMSNFAQGSYNTPAYIHPWLGPSGPAYGMSHPYGGKGGNFQPPVYEGQLPSPGGPQAPGLTDVNAGQPNVPQAPQPTNIPAAPSPTPVLTPQQAFQANEAYSEVDTGSMPHFSNFADLLSNMAFGPMGAMGKVASGLYGGEPTAFGQNFATVPHGWVHNHNNPSAGVSEPAGMGIAHSVGGLGGAFGGDFDDTGFSDFSDFDPDEGVGDGSW